jgi:hypothetical protein
MAKYGSDSVYRNTKIVDNRYLDHWENPIQGKENYSTQTIVIRNKFDQRPDLLAHELYGNAKLWWVFAEFNPDVLVDPIIDFKSGIIITVPTRFA